MRRANHAKRCAATSRRGRRSAPSLPAEPRSLTVVLVGRSRCDLPARVRAGGMNRARGANYATRCAATSRRGRRGAPSPPTSRAQGALRIRGVLFRKLVSADRMAAISSQRLDLRTINRRPVEPPANKSRMSAVAHLVLNRDSALASGSSRSRPQWAKTMV